MLSIIIPVYNAEKTIQKSLESVLSQTFQDFEIILVDDGSTDQSASICQEFVQKDPRISYYRKENGGVSSARNVGLDMAKGEWIGFIDSDDIIPEDMYEILMRETLASECQIGCCQIKRLTDMDLAKVKGNSPKVTDFLTETTVLSDEEMWKYFFMRHRGFIFWSPCNKIFHRSIVGSLRFDEDYSMGEDMYFCFQAISEAKRILFTPETFYGYVIWKESLSHTESFQQERAEAVAICEQIEKEMVQNHESEESINYARLSTMHHMADYISDCYRKGTTKQIKDHREILSSYRKRLRQEYKDLLELRRFKVACYIPLWFRYRESKWFQWRDKVFRRT